MKILRILRSLDPRCGGIADGVIQSSYALSALGCHVGIASLDPPESPWMHSCKFAVYGLGPTLNHYGYKPGLLRQLSVLVKSYDVIIIEGIWQYHSFAAWRVLQKTCTPYYVFPHGMLDPWFKHAYPLKHLKKSIYWPLADYWVLRQSRRVLFTTYQELDLAKQSFSLYKANGKVVGYGSARPPDNLSDHRSSFFSRYPHLRNKRILLFLSRIHPKKGLDLLLHAFASILHLDSRLHLVIAGPDDLSLKPKLQRLSRKLGILDSQITWTGMLTGHLKWGAYSSADLFCLPSHQENFGVVVAESLACGLPVCITNCVNVYSEVQAFKAGLVHADTLEGTKKALFDWLALDESASRRMSANALRLFDAHFDFNSVASCLLKVFEADLASSSCSG